MPHIGHGWIYSQYLFCTFRSPLTDATGFPALSHTCLHVSHWIMQIRHTVHASHNLQGPRCGPAILAWDTGTMYSCMTLALGSPFQSPRLTWPHEAMLWGSHYNLFTRSYPFCHLTAGLHARPGGGSWHTGWQGCSHAGKHL